MNQIGIGPLTAVDTTAQLPLGSKCEDASGNEYIYLQGVASTVLGSAVTYNAANATALLVANAVGPVAFAMGAIVANRYGWYCIKGDCAARAAAAVANNARLYSTATGGALDDAVVSGDLVAGAFSTSAPGGAGAMTVRIVYPFVTDTLS